MSFEEIQALRKSDPETAFQLAKSKLALDPFSQEARLSYGWVIYDKIKKLCTPEYLNDFEDNLIEISKLELEEAGKMLHNQLAWLIGTLVFEYTKEPGFDAARLEKLFELTKSLYFSRPAKCYSLLFKAFHKAFKDHHNYIELVEWWGYYNFIESDYRRISGGNELKDYSVAEQMHMVYSGHLCEALRIANGEDYDAVREKVVRYLVHLSAVIRKNIHFESLNESLVNLLTELANQGDDILVQITPFIRKRFKDFWVWDAVSEIYREDRQSRLAFLSKAVLCKAKEPRLLKTRLKMVDALIGTGYLPEAKTEIERINKICNEYRIDPPEITDQWMDEDWFNDISSGGNTMSLYRKFANIADEMIFGEIPEEIIVVDYVNDAKKMVSFITPDKVQGVFNYSRFLKRVKIGDVFNVRMEETRQEGRYSIFTLQKNENDYIDGILQFFEGPVVNPMDKTFGFVEGMFIPPDLYMMNNLRHGDFISGKALIAYNKKKEEWGWKVIALIKNW